MLQWAIIRAISALFRVAEMIIIIDVFSTWIPFLYENRSLEKLFYIIHSLTDPILKPIRALLQKTPLAGMPLDISPIIAIMLLGGLENIIIIIVAAVI